MKKFIAMLLMGTVLFSSIGCGGDAPKDKDKKDKAPTAGADKDKEKKADK